MATFTGKANHVKPIANFKPGIYIPSKRPQINSAQKRSFIDQLRSFFKVNKELSAVSSTTAANYMYG
jgi:hypothetical protein